ncbi:hypothetical protein UFOVP1290_396 [uncultured Caudovirales phage]|uniref:Uncharacterized protein n=1 Tax=uncultured Caudovirales phage TaxID=2100421 RepID=A0A6J5RRI6_9CAUD|nr:hypothetical protein UFOVP1290_396 [uncultured Caudovirales phage]
MMKSIGKLVYSPRSHIGSNERWLVLMCDDEISKYYRTLYSYDHKILNAGYSTKLARPVWGTHISIIRNEKIPNHNLWGLNSNKLIEFEYDGGVIDNGEYYWLKVYCNELSNLREKYGLSKYPKFGFHLTVGRTTQ